MKIIKSKIFKIELILFILGITLGIVSYIKLSNDTISETLRNYFINNDFKLISNLINNYLFLILIWISGYIYIFSFMIPLLIIYRGILNGFILTGLIVSFKLKGLLLITILLITYILITELLFLLLSYYSINHSIKTIKIIKYSKEINLKQFLKNYIYIFLFFLIFLFIASILETYISSFFIKFMI